MERGPAMLSGRTTLLIVLIVIALVVVGSMALLTKPRQYGNINDPITITIDESKIDDNWSLAVAKTPSGLLLSTITLTIRNLSGPIIAPMDSVPILSLDLSNWTTYRALFTKVGTESEVTNGERILIDVNAYPGQISYELRRDGTLVAKGGLP